MKQGELNVFLIAKYPVKVYFNAKVMMYEFVLVTKQTIYVYLSWQWILMIKDLGFVENVTDTMKLMKFFLFSFIIHVLYLSGLEASSTSYLIINR
jgi:hypothetical protein